MVGNFKAHTHKNKQQIHSSSIKHESKSELILTPHHGCEIKHHI